MNVSITKHANLASANAADLAAEYKYRGYEKHYAWDMFVKNRELKPEMNAKDFYALFDSVSACAIDKRVTVDFDATHYDNLLKMNCQITELEKWFEIVWSDGTTGSNPKIYPPEPERFIRLPTPFAPDKSGDSTPAAALSQPTHSPAPEAEQ
jgi:hypothetical protein